MAIIWNKSIKEFVGVVVSDKNSQTRTVLVTVVKTHPIYKKRFSVKKKYYVHDAENISKVDDKVLIRESKPISKTKKWVLIKVL